MKHLIKEVLSSTNLYWDFRIKRKENFSGKSACRRLYFLSWFLYLIPTKDIKPFSVYTVLACIALPWFEGNLQGEPECVLDAVPVRVLFARSAQGCRVTLWIIIEPTMDHDFRIYFEKRLDYKLLEERMRLLTINIVFYKHFSLYHFKLKDPTWIPESGISNPVWLISFDQGSSLFRCPSKPEIPSIWEPKVYTVITGSPNTLVPEVEPCLPRGPWSRR